MEIKRLFWALGMGLLTSVLLLSYTAGIIYLIKTKNEIGLVVDLFVSITLLFTYMKYHRLI